MDTVSFLLPSPQDPFLGTGEELQGNLEVPDRPKLASSHAFIYHGVWTSPQGQRLEVAVKEFKGLIPGSKHIDPIVLRERMDKRIRREILAWRSQRTHPNLHPLLGYRSEPQPRLISPWCRQGNLKDYLVENPGLSRCDKLCLLYQAALGLNHLHSCIPPICHGDIKPENVLINDAGQAALSDFGLSRVHGNRGLTTSESPRGTLYYMAGELFMNATRRPNLQSDVFAFGGLILCVMSGKASLFGARWTENPLSLDDKSATGARGPP